MMRALLLALAAFLAVGAAEARALRVQVDLKPEGPAQGKWKAWIPVPSSNALQSVSEIRWDKTWKGGLRIEKEYGNRYLYLESEASPKKGLSVSYFVERFEASAGRRDKIESRGKRLLMPDRLVPLGGAIAEEARNAKALGHDSLPRALYEQVVDSMQYDKSQPGWGQGDALRACDLRKGNCTDFHSLFIGMARASSIPSRFVMGFSVPKDKAGQIPGYHCWAEFWDATAKAWVPVDASEASKQPAKKDFFFGQLDDDRFELSQGRDVMLSPRPKSGRQNYLLHPIVEAGGAEQKMAVSVRYEEAS